MNATRSKKQKNSTTNLAAGAIFDIETFMKGEQVPSVGESTHEVYIKECLEKSLFQMYVEKLSKKPSCESYAKYQERGLSQN